MNPPSVPYDDSLGFRKTMRAPGDVIIEADVDERWHNPMGVLHGGILMGMMDSAIGASMTSLLEPGQTTTNTEFHARFLRPTVEGHLQAEATIVKRGRTMTFWEAKVTNEDGKLVATASSAFLTMTN